MSLFIFFVIRYSKEARHKAESGHNIDTADNLKVEDVFL